MGVPQVRNLPSSWRRFACRESVLGLWRGPLLRANTGSFEDRIKSQKRLRNVYYLPSPKPCSQLMWPVKKCILYPTLLMLTVLCHGPMTQDPGAISAGVTRCSKGCSWAVWHTVPRWPGQTVPVGFPSQSPSGRCSYRALR